MQPHRNARATRLSRLHTAHDPSGTQSPPHQTHLQQRALSAAILPNNHADAGTKLVNKVGVALHHRWREGWQAGSCAPTLNATAEMLSAGSGALHSPCHAECLPRHLSCGSKPCYQPSSSTASHHEPLQLNLFKCPRLDRRSWRVGHRAVVWRRPPPAPPAAAPPAAAATAATAAATAAGAPPLARLRLLQRLSGMAGAVGWCVGQHHLLGTSAGFTAAWWGGPQAIPCTAAQTSILPCSTEPQLHTPFCNPT